MKVQKHRCPKCSESITETIVETTYNGEVRQKHRPIYYPIKDEQGKLIWKNLFHIDMISLLVFISVIFLTIGYNLDMEKCNDAIKHPCTFCEHTGCYIQSSSTCYQKVELINETNRFSSLQDTIPGLP